MTSIHLEVVGHVERLWQKKIYHTYFRDHFFFKFLTLHWVKSGEKTGTTDLSVEKVGNK